MVLPIIKKIDIVRFLELSKTSVIADVRSPSEFLNGHIPGSVNIPLFDDESRKAVGTKYKKEGRIPAILEGLKLTAPDISSKLEQGLKFTKNGKLLIYCWRGGMRSEAMAWLFSLGDIETEVLDGGYKSYRHHVLESLSVKRKMIILGGMTGSSKTYILRFLKEYGKQVIDLEGLANHKGSAFGSLGEQPQPTTEHFSNLLFDEWRQLDINLPFWLEDESRNIGSVFMPEGLYLNMQEAPSIILRMDVKTRLPRLMKEYSKYPVELLKSSVFKIYKRLGGDNTKDAISAIENGDFGKAIEITLRYYDKAYSFGLKKKNPKTLVFIETDSDDIETNAMKVLDAANMIKWEDPLYTMI
jgi:tRNA 2-selenouridine synthase